MSKPVEHGIKCWLRMVCCVCCLLVLCSCATHEDNVSSAKKPSAASAQRLRSDLPTHWRQQYMQVPEFSTPIFVVQTGMEQAETVLLVHGLGQAGLDDWLTIIPVLEKRYHVIALDLPGFGRSQANEGRFTPTRYAQAIKHLIDSSAKPRPALVGHSLGGAVALRFAALYPDSVSRLVLVDAAGILERTAFLKINTAFSPDPDEEQPYLIKRMLESLDYLRSSLVEQSGFTPDPIDTAFHNDDAWRWLVGDSPNINAALALFTEDFSKAVFTVNVPTTLIWGSEDRVAPLRTGRMLAHRLPHAQLSVIEGAGHMPMKSHTEPFIALLQASLQPPTDSYQITPTVNGDDSSEPLLNLNCKRVRDAIYTGRYKRMVLRSCRHITLSNVQVENIIAERSDIVLDNVTVISSDVGIDSQQSLITATNLDIRAPVGIRATRSRLDLAGTRIQADQQALAIEKRTRLVLSTSQIRSPLYDGYAHGAFLLQATTLEQRLTAPPADHKVK